MRKTTFYSLFLNVYQIIKSYLSTLRYDCDVHAWWLWESDGYLHHSALWWKTPDPEKCACESTAGQWRGATYYTVTYCVSLMKMHAFLLSINKVYIFFKSIVNGGLKRIFSITLIQLVWWIAMLFQNHQARMLMQEYDWIAHMYYL